MKRRKTSVLAWLMAIAMVISLMPVTAMAATSYYVDVSITGPDAYRTTQTVSGSSTDGLAADGLAQAVVNVVVQKKTELARIFGGLGLSDIVNDGISEFQSGDWAGYVDTYFDEVSNVSGKANFKTLLSDKTTTLSDLTVNQANKVSYVDPYHGNTYTVTVTLRTREIGGGDGGGGGTGTGSGTGTGTGTGTGGSTDVGSAGGSVGGSSHPVIVQPTTNGGVSVGVSSSSGSSSSGSSSGGSGSGSGSSGGSGEIAPGQTVTIELDPADGFRTNSITVKDKNGNIIKAKALDNDTYTFVVPAGGVTVSTNFIVMPTPVEDTGVGRMLNTDPDKAYIQGKADGKFHPSDSITRGQVATIFYRLLKEEYSKVAQTKNFKDIPDDFWCKDAVNTLAALGIVNGMTADTFDPNKPITRAQFVAICARFADVSAEGEDFHDVPDHHWAYDYISTGSGHGWINGVGNGNFDPNAPITRAQAVTIVNRMLCRIAERATIDATEEQFYHDVEDTHWAWYDIGEASLGDLTRED